MLDGFWEGTAQETLGEGLGVGVAGPRVDVDLGHTVLDALGEEGVGNGVSAVEAEVWWPALEALLQILQTARSVAIHEACESTYMDCLKLGGLMYSPCKLPMEGARINAPVLPV